VYAQDAGNAAGLVYFIFDLLHLDGDDVGARPLIERRQGKKAGRKRAACSAFRRFRTSARTAVSIFARCIAERGAQASPGAASAGGSSGSTGAISKGGYGLGAMP
jgi:hypothetical protein